MRGNEKEFKETRLVILLLAVVIILLFGIIILLLARGDKTAPIPGPNKTERKDKVEKEEIKTKYKELDLTNECFNKNENCEKEYEIEYENNTVQVTIIKENEKFYLYLNNMETINSYQEESVHKIYLLDNGAIVLEDDTNNETKYYSFYSKKANYLATFGDKYIKNNNFKQFDVDGASYKMIDDRTFEVELKDKNTTKITSDAKSNTLALGKNECINSKIECEKEYELSNGNKDIVIKTIVKQKEYDELNDEYSYLKKVYIDNKLLDEYEDKNGYFNINAIALLDNNLIVIDYEGYNHPAYFGGKIYYQEDLSMLLQISDSRFLGGHLEGNIEDKTLFLYAGEAACTNDDKRIIHKYLYDIKNNHKYTITAFDKEKIGCAGQS